MDNKYKFDCLEENLTFDIVFIAHEMHWDLDYVLDLEYWRFEQVKIELNKYHTARNGTVDDTNMTL